MSDEKKILDWETASELVAQKQPIDFKAYDILDLDSCDLSSYEKICCKKNSEVNLGGLDPLPKILDVSECASLDLSGRDLSSLDDPIIMKEGSSFVYTNRFLQEGSYAIYPLSNVDFSRSGKVIVVGADLSAYSALKFKDSAEVNLSDCVNIPQNTDLSNCDVVSLCNVDLSQFKNLRFKDGAKIDLSGCTNVPKDLDLSRCSAVTIRNSDLSQFENLKFKDGAVVDLSGSTNIPQDLDFSACKVVSLAGCDLSGINDLQLRDGADLDLSGCNELPKKVDFDKCSYVDLSHTDLMFRQDIKFRDGAVVNLCGADNIPDDVDFSPCAKLDLQQCDLGSDFIGGERTITFREGAEVSLQKCTNLPKDIDFSPCAVVNVSGCDLGEQSTLKFKENARVAVIGATGIPQENNLNQCQEVWIGYGQAQTLDLGDAHVVLKAVAQKKLDLSKFKTVTTALVCDEILGRSAVGLVSTEEVIFRDRKQYEEFLANPDNVPIPESIKIVFADEQQKLVQDLSEQKGELPSVTKADAQSLRIDKAVSERLDEAKKTDETSKVKAPIEILPNQVTR